MTTAHTPGPWGISSQSPRIIKQYDGLGDTNVIIGSASGYPKSGFYPDDETALANARLIVAAPDLLEVLQVIAADSRWISGEPLLMQVRAAIAKATGAA